MLAVCALALGLAPRSVAEETLTQTPSGVAPQVPIITLEAADPGAAEFESSTGLFWVRRTGDTSRSLTIRLVYEGTAKADVDYQARPANLRGRPNAASPKTLTFNPGSAREGLLIVPIDDRLAEGEETVILGVVEPPIAIDPASGRSTSDSYTLGRQAAAKVVIADDEELKPAVPPKISLTAPAAGASFVVGTAVRVAADAADADGRVVRVDFYAGDRLIATDTSSPYTGTFNPTAAGIYAIQAKATDDAGLFTYSEPVKIEIKAREPAQPTVEVFALDAEATEPPTLIDALPGGIVLARDTAAFRFVRTGNLDVQLKVEYELGGSAANGLDYVKLGGVIEIPEGAKEARLVVTPLPDVLKEGAETVVLKVLPLACPKILPTPAWCYVVGKQDTARVEIKESNIQFNSSPEVKITAPRSGSSFELSATIAVNAEVTDKDGYPTTVEFFANGKSIGKRSLAFIQPPEPGGTYSFEIEWKPDVAGTFKLTAKATDNREASTTSSAVEIKVTGAPPGPLPVVSISAPDAEAAEPGANAISALNTATFRLTRTGDLTKALKVFYKVTGTAANGTDFATLDGDATIAAGSATRDILVSPKIDRVKEETETVVLTLREDAAYKLGTPPAAEIKLLDAGLPPVDPKPATLVIKSPADGATFEAPAEVRILATAIDPKGYISRVEFYDGDQRIGVSEIMFIRAPDPGSLIEHELLWKDAPAGSHKITARAKDTAGEAVVSSPVGFVVKEATGTQAVVTVTGVNLVAFEDQATPASVRVSRTGDTTLPLEVFYKTSGRAESGADYEPLKGSVVIPAGERSALIEIKPIADKVTEFIENVMLTVEAPVCVAIFPPPPGCYRVGTPASSNAYIVDGGLPPTPTAGTLSTTTALPAGIAEVAPTASGFTRLSIAGQPGATVDIEVSTDLVHWQPLGVTTLESSYAEVTDGSTGEARRFYRVVPRGAAVE